MYCYVEWFIEKFRFILNIYIICMCINTNILIFMLTVEPTVKYYKNI